MMIMVVKSTQSWPSCFKPKVYRYAKLDGDDSLYSMLHIRLSC